MNDPINSGKSLTDRSEHGFTNAFVGAFLHSNLSIVLVLLAFAIGLGALWFTPREENPQIVVPLADIFVQFPGYSAEEVERLVATPLEKSLYQIDGVEYVYSMSRPDEAIITVRFYVGEDRERSLVKLFKKIDESLNLVPPGVTGWVMKPVEIDDVPIVTLTLTSESSDEYILRRLGEELVDRLAEVRQVSRAYVLGGRPRVVHVRPDIERLRAYRLDIPSLERAIRGANVNRTVGRFAQADIEQTVELNESFQTAEEIKALVVGVSSGRPVFLRDVADVVDGPAEADQYVRHGWGPARGFEEEPAFPGSIIGKRTIASPEGSSGAGPQPAVVIAIAKQKGANAVWVARDVLAAMEELQREIVPHDVDVIITRNLGLTSNDKVNELIEALAVAVFIVIALLTLGLGWREAVIVAVAIPVVFGLTLMVNYMVGLTLNRVTLFALILSLGLLVDDPIVDVENISRHFSLHRRATRKIVLEAVAEIRPPLITATLAVIVSFLPMMYITDMMGPYMRPMALNVPVAMFASMLVAFTITPWMSYHLLHRKYTVDADADEDDVVDPHDFSKVRETRLYRLFHPLMAPLMRSRWHAAGFLAVILALTLGAAGLAVWRVVPLKMLPYGNKNHLQVLLDFDEGTTLEHADAVTREFEAYLAQIPEVINYTAYVGTASPMDFNGLVRHYYLRQGPTVADITMNLVDKKSRWRQSHTLALAVRHDLTQLADQYNVKMKIVESPPGPPTLAPLVAEVYGRPDHPYEQLTAAARTVEARMAMEPGVVDVDTTVETARTRFIFDLDQEKAALNGITTDDVARTLETALGGIAVGVMHHSSERRPLQIKVQLPRHQRSQLANLDAIHLIGSESNQLVPLTELGTWREDVVDQTIYHKNLRRVVYVFADAVGRPSTDAVVDLLADQVRVGEMARPSEFFSPGLGWVKDAEPRPLHERTFLSNGSDLLWMVPEGINVTFGGEGEWKTTLRVFRDLGLAFGAALVGIYILLVAQTGSFVMPLVVMLAIPLTMIGIMPGFWLLNVIGAGEVGGYDNAIFFTATGMIGMIALAGIVTRDAIILVDFIHVSLARGRSLFDAIMESRVVRLRPILLTAGTAMLSAVPITADPVFSGLAWSLIFGLLASTVFTLFVIPVCYWLIYAHRPGHGAPIRTP